MGIKSRMAGWVVGQVASDVLKNMNVGKSHRANVVKAVKDMIKPREEPVAWHGVIAVAVALAGAFGLDLTAEQLSVTVSTIITVGTFIVRRKVSPNR
tara:strand:+ start:330 stop:620 length:291 start_codon:yes stop_codon:yes gene_type:complete